MIREYYRLTKPQRTLGNVLVALGAYLFASGATLEWQTLLGMGVGLSFVVGAANAFNNYFDREMDAHMERTKLRALVVGKVSGEKALIFSLALFALGVLVLHLYTTPLALAVALLGFSLYVFAYTPLKPKSSSALFVGAAAGATPPVVGYTAVTNELDAYALALFGVLYFWQIPHFIAISIYRFEEYKAAGVPLYIQHPPSAENRKRARIVFHASLVVLLLLCLGLMLHRWVR